MLDGATGANGYDWIIFYVGTDQGAYDAIDAMREKQDQKKIA